MNRTKSTLELALESLLRNPSRMSISERAKEIGRSREFTGQAFRELEEGGAIIIFNGHRREKIPVLRPEIQEVALAAGSRLHTDFTQNSHKVHITNLDPAWHCSDFGEEEAGFSDSKNPRHNKKKNIFNLTSLFKLSLSPTVKSIFLSMFSFPPADGKLFFPFREELPSHPERLGAEPAIPDSRELPDNREFAAKFSGPAGPYKVKPPSDIEKGVWSMMLEYCDKSLFPFYVGLPQRARDVMFAVAYRQLLKDNAGVSSVAGVLLETGYVSGARKNKKRWACFQRARIWADYHTARYDDWCSGIFWHYKERPLKFKNTENEYSVVDIPFARLLAGPRARDVYWAYFKDCLDVMQRITRRDIERRCPWFLPEKFDETDEPSEMQIRFFTNLLAEIRIKADSSRMTVAKGITRYINNGIMSRKFAEDRKYNNHCPWGYKYGDI